MRSFELAPWILAAAIPLTLTVERLDATDPARQAGNVVAHMTSSSDDEHRLTFELANGQELTIRLVDGHFWVGDSELGTVSPRGRLHAAWRSVVREATGVESGEALTLVQRLEIEGLDGREASILHQVLDAVRQLGRTEPLVALNPALAGSQEQAPGRIPPVPQVPQVPGVDPVIVDINVDDLLAGRQVYTRDHVVPEGTVVDGKITMLSGDLTVRGRVRGDVMALDGDVILARGGVVEGDVQLLDGELQLDGGRLLGEVRQLRGPLPEQLLQPGASVFERTEFPTPPRTSIISGLTTGAMNLLATFIGLMFVGIGIMFFAPRQLEAVADTAWHSFGRSFLAGLFAQPLLIPLLALLVGGLTVTIVGILLVPFAITAFAAALFVSVTAGYIAIARTVGEIYVRRRIAQGLSIQGWLTYRYLIFGLIGVLAIWIPPVLFGWVPVAGTLMTIIAALLTWILATAGFGAMLLSRGGVRGTVVRRIDRALEDRDLWEPSFIAEPRRSGRARS